MVTPRVWLTIISKRYRDVSFLFRIGVVPSLHDKGVALNPIENRSASVIKIMNSPEHLDLPSIFIFHHYY